MSKLLLAFIIVGFAQHALLAPTVDPRLINSLRQKGTTNVLVSMKDSVSPVLRSLRSTHFSTRADRLNSVAKTLEDFATESQKNVHAFLEAQKVGKSFSTKSLWVTNQIIIKSADLDLVQKLAALDDISEITEEFFIELDAPLDLQVYENLTSANDDEVQWGVQQIEAPVVWNSGNKGQGILIATVDTGARYTHEALRNNYVGGEYGWFDPGAGSFEPNDNNGHGTHTTANIAGTARNIGVAPGTQWSACKGCFSSFCSNLDLLECGQWIACPTKADGSAPDCSKAPHLVSNSWGGGRGNEWYRDVVAVYRTSSIVPLFSIGNSGPGCGSANSPGDYENVIGVGATDIDNTLSSFSSVGPTYLGSRVKPDVSAPGANVFSAYHTSDNAYASLSGTSMACPHAAGVVALMLSENQNLNYDQVKSALEGGSVPTTTTGRNCGEIPEDIYPNHHVGYGRINAVRSINAVRKL